MWKPIAVGTLGVMGTSFVVSRRLLFSFASGELSVLRSLSLLLKIEAKKPFGEGERSGKRGGAGEPSEETVMREDTSDTSSG
jgi:hypothetical protein